MQSSGQSDHSFSSNGVADSKVDQRSAYSPQSFYSSSNYSAIYTTSSQDKVTSSPEKDGWNGAFDYAIFPRTSHSKGEHNSKHAREGNSRFKKHDYQDVYKDRKERQARRADKSKRDRQQTDTSSEKSVPVVPAKQYHPEESLSQPQPLIYEDLTSVTDKAPPRIAPISGYLAKVG